MRRAAVLLGGLLGGLALGTVVAAPAGAQQLSVGGFIGQLYDTEEDWLLFGGEIRWVIKEDKPFTFQPRAWINPYEGGSLIQVDANVLYEPAQTGKIRLYGGAGAAFLRATYGEDIDSDTKVGLNLIAGIELVLNEESKLRPFLHGQYTIVNDFGNNYTLSAGVAFRLK